MDKLFDQRVIDQVQQRLQLMQDRMTDSEQKALMAELQTDVSTLLEELQIAGEEIHAQNEELMRVNQVVLAERLRYQDLFELAPDGYLVTDTKGMIKDANHTAAAMFSVPLERLPGKPLTVFIAQDSHPLFFACLARLQAGAAVDDIIEVQMQPRRRAPFIASVAVRARREAPGAQVRLWWLLRDITARSKQAATLGLDESRVAALEAIIGERERMGRDLHDGVAQVLGYVRFRLYSVTELLKGGEIAAAEEAIGELEQVAQEANADLRQAIAGLRIRSLLRLGLVGSLREYLERFREQSGVEVELVVDENCQSRFTATTEVQLHSMIHEAFTNIRKHAQARHVSLRFICLDNRPAIVISDDGCGFDTDAPEGTQYGLGIMRERAQLIGAELRIDSHPGQGTRITIVMPPAEDNTGPASAAANGAGKSARRQRRSPVAVRHRDTGSGGGNAA